MRKAISIFIVLALIFCISACGGSEEEEAVQSQKTNYKIGISISQKTSFFEEYVRQLNLLAKGNDVEFIVKYADGTTEQQEQDVDQLIADGIGMLVIMPANVDSMDNILVKCEETNISIVNLLDPINGSVDVLISLDYSEMGKLAANMADTYLSKQSSKTVLLVEGPAGSFISQMIYDGFMSVANEKGFKVNTVHGNASKDKAEEEVSAELEKNNYKLIFSFGQYMTEGVLDACSKTDKDPQIITVDADMDLVKEIYEGNIFGCVYVSPEDVANNTLSVYEAIQSGGNLSSYIGVEIKTITNDTVADAISNEAKHAN
ncbi:MAG: substrate-binding domain-containing protein [Eubacteriales bacterium]